MYYITRRDCWLAYFITTLGASRSSAPGFSLNIMGREGFTASMYACGPSSRASARRGICSGPFCQPLFCAAKRSNVKNNDSERYYKSVASPVHGHLPYSTVQRPSAWTEALTHESVSPRQPPFQTHQWHYTVDWKLFTQSPPRLTASYGFVTFI